MNKIILTLSLLIASYVCTAQQSFYDLKSTTIDGKEFNFSELKGKKVLIVNTASKCGYTPQYEDLEKLYKTYQNKNFIIIGFPANDFMKQEPGSNADIKDFCSKNYGVTFLMMEKISVKGDDMHPVYKWLTNKTLNNKLDSSVKWNFQKYMVDETGALIDVATPNEKPLGGKIEEWINKP